MSAQIRARIEGQFTATYLTVLSVIQSVVFGFLAITIYEAHGGFDLPHWLLSAATFMMVVAIWHEFMMGATSLIWIPSLADSILPFLLGAAEFLVVAALPGAISRWCGSMAIVSLMMAAAHLNMVWRARKDPANLPVLRAFLSLSAAWSLAPSLSRAAARRAPSSSARSTSPSASAAARLSRACTQASTTAGSPATRSSSATKRAREPSTRGVRHSASRCSRDSG